MTAPSSRALVASHAAPVRGERGPLITSAQVTAEVDYLLGERIGSHASPAFIEDLAAGLFRVECLLPDEYEKAAQLSRQVRPAAPGWLIHAPASPRLSGASRSCRASEANEPVLPVLVGDQLLDRYRKLAQVLEALQ